ncbi:iron chaperone [Pengzhenrongella phosphoraccumulans]|uniref:iron chaperone n=1 Tax=Pengzhenrongella phosphoraccumulans TaxID=3114394 RepID=UPI00388DEDBB
MESIEAALAATPAPERDALLRVIDIARQIAPQAVDGVSYAVPALMVAGKPLVGVSAAARHLSVYPFSPAAIDTLRAELDGFSVSKGTIRFTVERQLPEALIVRLVQARLAEITA